ncbi:hypothetical protein O6H91_19G036800 [Diphasiastrum complanatum]|uniref:Uncharacterized protein n=1 Tax=Diphasiastrum complanatum TaxID=34168 RepID=A0ACC2AU52_DIPCM|nr:hypothetical protein O6H91_19G036800 [Diphasiastrum complanatum]
MQRVCSSRVLQLLNGKMRPCPSNEAVAQIWTRRSLKQMILNENPSLANVICDTRHKRCYQAPFWKGAQRGVDTATASWDVGHPPTDEKHLQRGESRPNRSTSLEKETGSVEATSEGTGKGQTVLRMISEDEGESVWALGIRVKVKCPGEMTEGSFSLLEYHVAPGDGSALHTHWRESESWYMLDGSMQWMLGDQTFSAHKGSFIYLPKEIPHAFHNNTNDPATMLVSCLPSGFEKFFLEIGMPVNPNEKKPQVTEEEARRATQISNKYGLSFKANRNQ